MYYNYARLCMTYIVFNFDARTGSFIFVRPSWCAYTQVNFDKTAAGGIESKEGQGDIVSCRNACNKLPYTDCKAFVVTKAGKCRLFKGPTLPTITDQAGDIVVERDEQCESKLLCISIIFLLSKPHFLLSPLICSGNMVMFSCHVN